MTKKPSKSTKKTASSKDTDSSLFELRPLRDAKPLAKFMCFDTPDPNIYLKCDWNPKEQRFNKNCRQVGHAECKGGA